MRTMILMLGLVLVVAAGAGLYVWMQPPGSGAPAAPTAVEKLAERAARAAPAAAAPAANVAAPTTATAQATATPATAPVEPPTLIHEGQDVWVKVPDEKTGRLAWQFRASRYDPQPDNSMNVTNPQAEFFFGGGQTILIAGTHGRVVIPGNVGKSADFRTPAAPPSRGELYDVTISLYAPDRPKHPTLVARVNNVAFDNDTFRIATESFTGPDGKLVPADQVPVELRGDEYDFDGRGLTIRWNDRDRRLQMLEIAHGEKFVIRNKAASPAGTAEQKAAGTGTGRSSAGSQSKPKAPSTPSEREAAAGSTSPPGENKQPVYRATFDGGVRVTQGDESIAQADVMRVDFRPEGDQAPIAPDVTQPAPPAARPNRRQARTGNSPARNPAAAPKPLFPTSRKSNSPQGDQPVIVRWPGKLVMVPVAVSADEGIPTLQPGQRSIEMISTSERPVTLNYSGSHVTCASFVYSEADDSLLVRSSPAVPVITLKDAGGALFYTPSINYSGTEGKAVADGAGRLEFPLRGAEPGAPDEVIKARWSKSCVLTLLGSSFEELKVEHADITGDVVVDHSKLKLSGDSMEIAFAPPAPDDVQKSPQVKQVIASGSVKCDMRDEQDKLRHITCDRLTVDTVTTAKGQVQPRVVRADGNARTFAEGPDAEELSAGRLVATLAPTTRPTDPPRIARFFAQQDVRFKSKDAWGQADQLDAIAADDAGKDYQVMLKGQPFATVTSQGTTLSGAIINFDSRSQKASVNGGGSLKGMQPGSTPQDKPTPFEVTWEKYGLTYDGAADTVDIKSNVSVTTVASNGSRNTASGDTLTLVLMDDPKAATRPSKPTASTRPAGMFPGMESMGQKTVSSMKLKDNAEVVSVMSAPDGSLLRRVHLFAPEVQADARGQQIVVPAAGRMLYEDRRPTTQPSTQPLALSPLGDMSGATAFQWSRRLTFDQTAMRAQMIGDVAIVHEDANAEGKPYRLDADQVTADFERDPKAVAAATTRPVQGGDSMMPLDGQAKVKLLTAEGAVQFVSREIEFNADHVTFDPDRALLKARGNQRNPVRVNKGLTQGSFLEVWWDTRSQSVRRIHDVQATVRQ